MRLLITSVALCSIAAAQTGNPITKAAEGAYARAKQNLIESADVMPEKDWSFRLTPEQRTWGEWVTHTAILNEGSCNALKGVAAPPMDHSKHAAGSGKADMVKLLKTSFDSCDAAYSQMTDAKAGVEIAVGDRKVLPAATMINHIATLNAHYGNMVGYMRSKGIVPPSTARSQKKKK